MQKIEFIKMHGLGNDFVIIDNRINSILITPSIINKLSNRKFGAGCDQLITINKSIGDEDARIEIFNPNGDKAEACGNGTRCVAKLLFEESKKKSINILSEAGILNATYKNENNISVNMGKLHTKWNKIPLIKGMDTMNIPIEIEGFSLGVAVNIGNPHIVFFVNNIESYDIKKIGPEIENNNLFPERCNVTLAKKINDNSFKIKVWERGAGLTKACGTAACATAVAANINGLTKSCAKEVGTMGITVNSICPGLIMTDIVNESGAAAAESMGLTFDEMVEQFSSESSIKRPNTVEEVAAMAVLLASDEASGITGALLSVDGGTAAY